MIDLMFFLEIVKFSFNQMSYVLCFNAKFHLESTDIFKMIISNVMTIDGDIDCSKLCQNS